MGAFLGYSFLPEDELSPNGGQGHAGSEGQRATRPRVRGMEHGRRGFPGGRVSRKIKYEAGRGTRDDCRRLFAPLALAKEGQPPHLVSVVTPTHACHTSSCAQIGVRYILFPKPWRLASRDRPSEACQAARLARIARQPACQQQNGRVGVPGWALAAPRMRGEQGLHFWK